MEIYLVTFEPAESRSLSVLEYAYNIIIKVTVHDFLDDFAIIITIVLLSNQTTQGLNKLLNNPDNPYYQLGRVTAADLVSFAYQIASGMVHVLQ